MLQMNRGDNPRATFNTFAHTSLTMMAWFKHVSDAVSRSEPDYGGRLCYILQNPKYVLFTGDYLTTSPTYETSNDHSLKFVARWDAGDPSWQAATAYNVGDTVCDVAGTTTRYYRCITGGTSGGGEPAWNVWNGATTNDNTVVWRTYSPIYISYHDDTWAINTWVHVAVTYDASAWNNAPLIYVNGVSVSVGNQNYYVPTANSSLATNLSVGGGVLFNSTALNRGMDGYVEDVRHYDRILSANEIMDIYTSRGKDNIVHGLLNRFPCNESYVGDTVAGAEIKDWGRHQLVTAAGGTITYDESRLTFIKE